MWLGPPTLPFGGPLSGHLFLRQALPRAHMHLTEALVDPRLQADQRRKRSRRRQRPPQRTRHDRSHILTGQLPCHRFRIAQRGRLDTLVEPPHHPLLCIPRGAPMTHEMNQLHSAVWRAST